MTLLEIKDKQLRWTPTEEDVGMHNIEIVATDQIAKTTQSFSLYVNKTPQIISADSLSIFVGDTLKHLISAHDQNATTGLTYSIRTKINNIYLNGQSGELTWAPQTEDLGRHTVEVAVSDGFDQGTDIQKIKIFVQGNPKFLKDPPSEAFVNTPYLYAVKAQNAYGGQIPKKDFFLTIEGTTISNLRLDSLHYIITATPTEEELGKNTMTLSLKDLEGNTIKETFNILVLINPCEIEEQEEQEKPTPKPQKPKEQKTQKPKKPPLFHIPH